MMRAMLAGVSGLKAHQEKMDVIGNNIANINTTGFKSSRVTFRDIFSQTLSSATGANSTAGTAGNNAKQVGLGSQVSAIDMQMTQGSTETTGNSLDLAINGSGFFIVRNGTTGQYMFTRDGSFKLDENGNLNSNGMNVYGWYADPDTGEFDTDEKVQSLNLYSDSKNGNKKIISGEATTKAAFAGSLDSSASTLATGTALSDDNAQYKTTTTVYDSLGNSHELTIKFWKTATSNATATNPITTWTYSVSEGDTELPISTTDTGAAGSTTTTGTLDFQGTNGTLYQSSTSANVAPYVYLNDSSTTGAAPLTFQIDFSTLTTTSGTSTVAASDVNGCVSGTLESYSIDSNGVITGVYSNGLEQSLGMVALAQFDNPAGLQSTGSNYYVTSQNSGEFTNGVAANNTLESGCLEMSNVDLSTEFANMIVTQRGYQANSRIITACDELLQTVLDMKR